jgi:hypothetical protein
MWLVFVRRFLAGVRLIVTVIGLSAGGSFSSVRVVGNNCSLLHEGNDNANSFHRNKSASWRDAE